MPTMNRSGRDEWNRPCLGSSHDNGQEEDDYAVPEEDYDDGMVHIQPARHCPPNTEYADRSLHRPVPSVPSECGSKLNTHPSPPKRVIPGPAVNRDLKPGRQAKHTKEKTEGLSMSSVPDLHQRRRSPPRPAKPVPVPRGPEATSPGPRLPTAGHGGYLADPPMSHTGPARKEPAKPVPAALGHDIAALGSRLPAARNDITTLGLRLPTPGKDITAFGLRPPSPSHGGYPADTQTSHTEPAWKEQQKAYSKGLIPSGGSRGRLPQRLSLDLESQELFDSRQMPRKEGLTDGHSMKRHHHEWPQDKDDLDHIDFHPQERPAEMSDWYVGDFSRVEADHALHLVNRDGAFLVRDCSKCTCQEPLVLAVFYENRVFNIQIRYSHCTSKYTLGTGLRTNDTFDTVPDIIKFHSIFPIALIDGRNPAEDSPRRACVLMHPITRMDMLQLLNIKTTGRNKPL